jgi:uncharacterized membrane protein YbhN (UPF0104 family)
MTRGAGRGGCIGNVLPVPSVLPVATDLLTDGRPLWRLALASRRRLVAAGAVAAGGAAYVALGGPVATLGDAAARVAAADPAWLAAGAVAEVVSIAGYVALLALVAGVDRTTSYRISLGGAAITRLLPTAGLGGVAFTVWALRRDGRTAAGAGMVVLRFLVVLYAVFLLALLAAALLVAARGGGDRWALVPALAAALAMATAAGLGLRARRGGDTGLGPAVRDAAGLVRGADPRLAGVAAWWAADVAVLWATFHAVGAAPALPVVLLAYFLGAVGNTVPVPGAMSGGMIGVAIALGVAPAAAIAAVLSYRAIAVWLPVPFGAAALAALRRPAVPVRARPAPAPRPRPRLGLCPCGRA